jgi:hypothetical protein
MKYTITVDDNDREEAPAKPWVATIDNEDLDSGIGATPAEAVADLLAQWEVLA